MSRKTYAYSLEADGLLAERAAELAEAPVDGSRDHLTFICLTAGHLVCALPGSGVLEVLNLHHRSGQELLHAGSPGRTVRRGPMRTFLLAVPHTPAFILGMIHHRGRLYSVLDLSSLILGSPATGTEQSQIVLIRECGAEISLLSDGDCVVMVVPSDQTTPSVDMMPERCQPFLAGTILTDNAAIGILDPGKLVAHPSLATLAPSSVALT